MTYDPRENIEEYYPSIRPQTPAPEVDPDVLETHLLARNNPHVVTAEQVDTYTKSVIDSKISTATTLNKQALDEAVHKAEAGAIQVQKDAERVDGAILGLQSIANKADKAAKIAQAMRDEAVTAAGEAKGVVEIVSRVYRYRGSVSTKENLPTDAKEGDVYNVETDGMNYAWTGETWDSLGPTVDLSAYATKQEVGNALGRKQDKLTAGQNITIENGVISAIGNDAEAVHYVDPNGTTEIGDKRGKAIFAADADGVGGVIIGGSQTSQPSWTMYTAKLNWDKIRAYNEPGKYEDYSYKPDSVDQIARMKDLGGEFNLTDNNLSGVNPDDESATSGMENNPADIGLQYGELKYWGLKGDSVKLSTLRLYRRGGGTPNANSNIWLHVLRNFNGTWKSVYISSSHVTHGSYTRNGQSIDHTMVLQSGMDAFIPTDENVIIAYFTTSSKIERSGGSLSATKFGAKVVASPMYNASSPYVTVIDENNFGSSVTPRNKMLAMKATYVAKYESKVAVGGSITVDTALSATSTNPVQNKVVKAALDKKLEVSSEFLASFIRYDDSPNVAMIFGAEFQDSDKGAFLSIVEDYNGKFRGVAFKDGEIKWVDNSGNVHTETLGGGSATPTMETAAWSGTICSIAWSANPITVDFNGQNAITANVRFPSGQWPEGATRMIFFKTGGIINTYGDPLSEACFGAADGCLSVEFIGYEYLEENAVHHASAYRFGNVLYISIVARRYI